MKILEVTTNPMTNEMFDPFYINDDGNIVTSFLNADGENYTSIIVDGSDYPMMDVNDPVQTIHHMVDLKETLENLDDTSMFEDDGVYINIIDDLATNIKLATETLAGEDAEEADSSEENDDDEPKLLTFTMPGQVYSTKFDSINWDWNHEHIKDIEAALCQFHEMTAEMMAGKKQPSELIETADQILQNMNLDTNYIFPLANSVTDREMAIIKMFDVFAAYSTIFAYTKEISAKRQANNDLNQLINIIQSIPNDNVGDGDESSMHMSDMDDDDVTDVHEAAEAIKTDMGVNVE